MIRVLDSRVGECSSVPSPERVSKVFEFPTEDNKPFGSGDDREQGIIDQEALPDG